MHKLLAASFTTDIAASEESLATAARHVAGGIRIRIRRLKACPGGWWLPPIALGCDGKAPKVLITLLSSLPRIPFRQCRAAQGRRTGALDAQQRELCAATVDTAAAVSAVPKAIRQKAFPWFCRRAILYVTALLAACEAASRADADTNK